MAEASTGDYILGLDIGTSSIGWAILRARDGKPTGLERTGVRIFQAGMDGSIEAGRGEPRNAKRRQMRQQRRQTERRSRRMRKLFRLLQRNGLLPEGRPSEVLPVLDQQILTRYSATGADSRKARDRLAHILPYWLRTRALDQKLASYELGRAIYHLAQRRGYSSNRRVPEADDEEKGDVLAGIAELEEKMEETGARTLGEYFAGLRPRQERIRARWTSRNMYLDEFEAIWNGQQPHHPEVLTDELREAVHHAIFYQRPLRKQKNLIGHCILERDKRRAPWALLAAQRFRLLQRINDTRVIADGRERDLRPDEREVLLDRLEHAQSMTFAKARKLINLPRGRTLNWENGGEKRFLGNTTNAKLAEVFGERWEDFSDAERRQIVEDVRSFEKKDALARRGMTAWGLDDEAATAFAALQLEEGHCRHSRQAIRKLLPLLEEGVRYSEAVKRVYPHRFEADEPMDILPPVDQSNIELRNPAVQRVMTELRTVVNNIVRRYGKPAQIRIELARDLRRSKKQRQQATARNRRNEKAREEAAQKILDELNIANASRADIEKVLLAEECNWTCPYTGQSISMTSLFGQNPRFDVEHIVPFSRSLNNSYINKTICEISENRNVKRNLTPFEAYGSNDERWHEIIERVKRFQGDARDVKLRLFQTRDADSLEEAVEQQLNDTRYASRLAMEYLGLLYGGSYDSEGVRRVQAGRGGITYFIRNAFGLNTILGDGDLKTRDDHRHHAVDAVAVALTDAAHLKGISQAVSNRNDGGRVRLGAVPMPWPDFLEDVRESIGDISVSHGVKRKVRGALHEETLYGPSPELDKDGTPVGFRVRRPLEALSAGDVNAIVDDTVRQMVRDRLDELGGTPRTVFQDPENHPAFETDDGRRIPIHKVRIEKNVSAQPVGSKENPRHALPGSNHHMEIVKTADGKWKGYLVPLQEAANRVRAHRPIVQRQHGEDERFVFSVAPGEMLQLELEPGEVGLYVVRSISKGKVEFVDALDARIKSEIKADGAWTTRSPNKLQEMNAQKVTVTPMGEVRWAND